MKTFILDIFPKIQKYSEKLDNLTLLQNQHWVSIDDVFAVKMVYIFRDSYDLLISTNGKVEKAKWEYLGNKALLIDKKDESYLFKHGFFDENILALKVDSTEEYAIFVNENKYEGDLDSVEKVVDFLKGKYLDSNLKTIIESRTGEIINPSVTQEFKKFVRYETDKGIIEIEPFVNMTGSKAYQNGNAAEDGIYKLGFMQYTTIKNGVIIKS